MDEERKTGAQIVRDIMLGELASVRGGIRTKQQALDDALDKALMWQARLKEARAREIELLSWCRENDIPIPEF
jgi:hypothetical protein